MEYLEALEDERRKMEVFHRELPLCLQLVTQTIQSIRQGELKEFPGSSGEVSPPPVLEEFIPLKPSLKEEGRRCCEERPKEKPDWLQSVQLWRQEPEPEPVLESEKIKDEQSPTRRKARRSWSPELHRKFLHALEHLGGSNVATPKQIREIMKVDGLTNDEVKSHLQKFRLHTKRPAPAAMSSSNSSAQTPHLMVVGGIWVQPIEYTAVPLQTTMNGATKSTSLSTSNSSQTTTVSPANMLK